MPIGGPDGLATVRDGRGPAQPAVEPIDSRWQQPGLDAAEGILAAPLSQKLGASNSAQFPEGRSHPTRLPPATAVVPLLHVPSRRPRRIAWLASSGFERNCDRSAWEKGV